MTGPETQLEFVRRLYDEHRPRDGRDAQLMVYDYVPEWFKENVPALYATDNDPDPIIWRKYFLTESYWTFYVTEYSEVAPDGTPYLFFGYLASPLGPDCDELCYMALEQIQNLQSPRLKMPAEVDLYWQPIRLSDLKAKLYPEEDDKPDAVGPPNFDDLDHQARRIHEEQGEPCSVIVGDGQISDVITPSWLYWMYCGEKEELDSYPTSGLDTSARSRFIGGAEEDPEFHRFCRCIVQGLLLGQGLLVCQGAFENGGDYAASPAWQNWVPYIGEMPRPEPKFEIGDYVHFGWASDPYAERHSIWNREWREYEGKWCYKASGKWWGEDGMIPANTEPEPAFKKGESVWWYEGRSRVKTGTVQYTPAPYDVKVVVSYNERSVAKGVVIDQMVCVNDCETTQARI